MGVSHGTRRITRHHTIRHVLCHMPPDTFHHITRHKTSRETWHMTHYSTWHNTIRLVTLGIRRNTLGHWRHRKIRSRAATSLENKLFWRLEATADFDGHWLRLGPSSSERLQPSRRRLQTRPSPGEESGNGVVDLKVSVDIIDEGKRGTLWMQSFIHRAKLLRPLSQHAIDQQMSAYNHNFMTFIPTHGRSVSVHCMLKKLPNQFCSMHLILNCWRPALLMAS